MPRGIELRRRDDGSPVVVVELPEEVDLANDAAIRGSLTAAFDDAELTGAPVIIDCSAVTFLALSGIRALLDTKQRYRRDTRLRLVGPPGGHLEWMVDLLGLVDVFEVHPTVADASR